MESNQQAQLSEALSRLWQQFLPQMEERMAALEAANQALSEGKLTVDQRVAANSAAHKLAGVLGTFGLTRGTVLAREAELIYADEDETDPKALEHLLEIAQELRTMIANHR